MNQTPLFGDFKSGRARSNRSGLFIGLKTAIRSLIRQLRFLRKGDRKMRRATGMVVAAVMVLFFAVGSGLAQEIETGRHGTLGCIGKHFFRPGEIELTNLAFRNFNSDQTVRITDITIFSDTGAILARLSPGPGAFAVLGPHQSMELGTTEVFGNAPPGPASETFQIVVNWVSDRRGLALFGHAARLTRERNDSTGALGGVKARGLLRCVTLSLS